MLPKDTFRQLEVPSPFSANALLLVNNNNNNLYSGTARFHFLTVFKGMMEYCHYLIMRIKNKNWVMSRNRASSGKSLCIESFQKWSCHSRLPVLRHLCRASKTMLPMDTFWQLEVPTPFSANALFLVNNNLYIQALQGSIWWQYTRKGWNTVNIWYW